ncbi:hypothetical protein AB4Z30_02130 [Paenibacillus sp. 2TAF8]|uniref:hypothetical protein n=1 Tax=Paenibacillus sp. 2TAF8 TaxID=3233020 RepID=UPI003F99C6E7
MKKMQLIVSALIFSLLFANVASAKSYESLPSPEWSTEYEYYNPDLEKVGDTVYIIDSNGVQYMQDSNGSKKNFVENRGEFTHFRGDNALDEKNGKYYTVISSKINNKKVTQLFAYDKMGKKLWNKTFSEKLRDLNSVYITSDGYILVTARISSYNFMAYKFDENGKMLKKKQIKEHIYFYMNGFLVTTSDSKNKIYDSFYNDQLSLKFKYERSGSKMPDYIDKDGTVYFNTFNGKYYSSFGARGTNGKEIWSIPSNGNNGLEFLKDKLLIIDWKKNTLLLLDKKGKLLKKAKFNEIINVDTNSDNKILIVEKTKLTILNGTDLNQISEVIVPEIIPYKTKFHLKEGFNLYITDAGKTISKYLLN